MPNLLYIKSGQNHFCALLSLSCVHYKLFSSTPYLKTDSMQTRALHVVLQTLSLQHLRFLLSCCKKSETTVPTHHKLNASIWPSEELFIKTYSPVNSRLPSGPRTCFPFPNKCGVRVKHLFEGRRLISANTELRLWAVIWERGRTKE